MSNFKQKTVREIRSLLVVTLYFSVWVGSLVLLKHLLLAQYDIVFYGWSAAAVGVLVLAKVVLILERVPLGAWVRRQPAWVDVVLRTILYALGVVAVLALEHGIRGASTHGGFVNALVAALRETNAHHILANALCITGALLVYNALAVIREHLGEGGLRRIFLHPLPPAQSDADAPSSIRD